MFLVIGLMDLLIRFSKCVCERCLFLKTFVVGSALFAVLLLPFAACNREKDEPKSAACDILLFSVDALTWSIDSLSISRSYPPDTEESLMTPVINLSPGATVNPPSGEAQNFFVAGGVRYTVTAEDGVSTKVYTVKALRALSTECAIVSFSVDGLAWDFVNDSLIAYTAPEGMVESLLTPIISLPAGATVYPPSGEAQNFFTEEGVRYTVTSEDGLSTRSYVARIRRTYSSCDILSFSVNGVEWNISDTLITSVYNSEILQGHLTPTIVLSSGARVNPPASASQNFFTAEGVQYTVTSEDGKRSKVYTVRAVHVVSGVTGDCIWTLSSNQDTITISGNGAMEDYYSFVDEELQIVDTPWREYSTGITTVVIADGVTYVGRNAFRDVVSREDEYALYGALTSVILSNSVKETGYASFAYCRHLRSVTFGNSLETIGGFTFYNCFVLESAVIPNSVRFLKIAAFNGCLGLKSVVIGNSVEEFDEYVFFNCSSLEYVTIPASVATIKGQVFAFCNALTGVTNLRSIPQNIRDALIFNGVHIELLTLKVPASAVGVYRGDEDWGQFGSVTGI